MTAESPADGIWELAARTLCAGADSGRCMGWLELVGSIERSLRSDLPSRAAPAAVCRACGGRASATAAPAARLSMAWTPRKGAFDCGGLYEKHTFSV